MSKNRLIKIYYCQWYKAWLREAFEKAMHSTIDTSNLFKQFILSFITLCILYQSKGREEIMDYILIGLSPFIAWFIISFLINFLKIPVHYAQIIEESKFYKGLYDLFDSFLVEGRKIHSELKNQDITEQDKKKMAKFKQKVNTILLEKGFTKFYNQFNRFEEIDLIEKAIAQAQNLQSIKLSSKKPEMEELEYMLAVIAYIKLKFYPLSVPLKEWL